EGHLASWAFRDEAFWQSQVNFEPPNPTTDEKALWSEGKRVRCHTPYLPKVPRGRADDPGSDSPPATPARPGKATRLGVRGSIVPAASQTSYSSFLKVGGSDLFSVTEKKWSRFDSAQPNDTSNTNDLCLECVARSLLYKGQQQTRPFHYFFHDERTASASVEVVEGPPESKGELLRVKRRLLSQPTRKPILSGRIQVALNAPQSESKRMGQGEVWNESRVDLWQSRASRGMAACAVPSFRIPDRFRH
ncbi:UNVERIFIED_CONTAM: putative mitochondrial protein, partial [Sesamum indicum]